MLPPEKILVVQTAFLGDVVLTLPLVQALHHRFPEAKIDFLTTPIGAEVLRNNPLIDRIIEYDKRGKDRGLAGMMAMKRVLKERSYSVALVPHRSFRSAAIVALAGIPARIGFSTSAGRFLFTGIIQYQKTQHEVERNLAFLSYFGIGKVGREYPQLFPSKSDVAAVDAFLFQHSLGDKKKMVAIAPGSVWNTKRWLPENFATLAKKLSDEKIHVVLVGGEEDKKLCGEIAAQADAPGVTVAAGALSILQSAELLRRCVALVTNDSAPMHLAVAMRTRVVAIFGATVPAFGFAPYGEGDVVVETEGLTCRPCSIHGGEKCPIGTFECMKKISSEMVFEKLMAATDRLRPLPASVR
ncbi:MAG TPA: lipopolysaccharide heptosyltransferase II [Bacteroidota bacterium]|nr:lipopolysaccharide heptosyltransferase II [Bacteroidota bacterium]